MRIFKGLIKDFDENPQMYNAMEIKIRHNVIDQRFVFALTWSIGGALVREDRKPFDLYMKRLLGKDIPMPKEIVTKKISLPEQGTMFDYEYRLKENKTDGEWVKWSE